MITFVSGMPGDGKSYYVMTEIERALVDSDRMIVTNIQLKLGNVAEYLHKKYGKTFNLHSRYFLLDSSQSKKFWLYRGTHELHERFVDDEAPVPEGYEKKQKKPPVLRTDFATLDPEQPGVKFVIDEVHIHYNARNWQNCGHDALEYTSQHRHFGDDVVLISQRAKQVDSQLRSISGTYIYMKNLANRTLKMGPFVFRFGKSLIARAYADEWNKGGAEPTQMWSTTTKVDPEGHGSWYDTAAGVGHKGGGSADKNFVQSKGLHWSWMFIGLAAAVALIFFVPRLIGYGINESFGSLHDRKSDSVDPMATNGPVVLQAGATPLVVPTVREPVEVPELDSPAPLDLSDPQSFQVRPDGFVTLVTRDGQQITSADGIKLIGRNGFKYKDRVYPMP